MILVVTYPGADYPIFEYNAVRWYHNPSGDLCIIYDDESGAMFERGNVEQAWLDRNIYNRYGAGPVIHADQDDVTYYSIHDREGRSYAGP